MGYSLGCLLNVLFWNINREKLTSLIVDKSAGIFNKSKGISKLLGTIIFSMVIILVYLCLSLFANKEVYNFFTVFLVLNISNKEKQIMEYGISGEYESSIETLCYGIVCGFIAPLCIIVVAGNLFAVIYFFLMILDRNYPSKGLHIFTNIINIIPCFIAEVFIIIINIYKVKKFKGFFTYGNLKNFIIEPLLGVSILCSYLYDFNFASYKYKKGSPSYFQYYGPNKSMKIDLKHIDRGLKQGYIICLFSFIIFIFWHMKKIGVL